MASYPRRMQVSLVFLLSLLLTGVVAAAIGEFQRLYVVTGFTPSERFDRPEILALGEKERILLVGDPNRNEIDVFNLQGVGRYRIPLPKEQSKLAGLLIDSRSRILATDGESAIVRVLDLHGKLLAGMDLEAMSGLKGIGAGRLTIDRDANLYVADIPGSRILVFDKNNQFRFAVGQKGDKAGEFKMVSSVAVDRQGKIYVTDSMGVPIQVFDRRGRYLYGFGRHGEDPEDYLFPTAIRVDRHDQLWVVDTNQHTLRVLDRNGFQIRRFLEYGLADGRLFYPSDIALDQLGRVYVLEKGSRRLQVFSIENPLEPFGR